MNKIVLLFTALLAGIVNNGFCQQPKVKAPLIAAIKESDLKKDLFEMTADHFRGREAGTLDELKVSVWWATRLQQLGLTPAGDDGTFFQFFR